MGGRRRMVVKGGDGSPDRGRRPRGAEPSRSASDSPAISDAAQEAAEEAGLRYTTDARPGIRRVRRGKGFSYHRSDGERITEESTLRWIRSLVIPPAWREVWISTDRQGHLLATGRDDKGRKQYLYHPRWREVRDADKFDAPPHVWRAAAPLAETGRARSHRRGGYSDRGDGSGGAAARRNTDPCRQPRVRQGQRDLRSDHPSPRSRGPRRRRPGLRLSGQGWCRGAAFQYPTPSWLPPYSPVRTLAANNCSPTSVGMIFR